MKKPNLNQVKKVLKVIEKSDRKYLSLDSLAREVGVYSDVLGDALEYFDPMVRMDASFNTKTLLEPLKEYVSAEETRLAELPNKPKRIAVTNKEVNSFPTIGSFVYSKMTSAGGLVDQSNNLDDHDLHLLKKLVDREIASRKKAKRAKNKKK